MANRYRILAAAAALLVLLILTAIMWTAHDTNAGQSIDISGEWNFEVGGFGEGTFGCSSAIAQSGSSFTMDTDCPGLGLGEFTGSIDPATGEFTASGQLVGIPVELAGTVSPDGESLSGMWDAELIGLSGTLTATRKGPLLTPTPVPTLSAPVDVTGSWRISFSGIFGGTCDAVIEQTDAELFSIADCTLIGTIRLNGSLDQTDGRLTLASSTIVMEGFVTADGNSVSGTWSALGLFSGTLTAERVDDIELIDVSGRWDALLIGETRRVCTLEVDQGLVDARGVLECDGGPATDLTGSVNPFGGFLTLSGTIGDEEVSLGGSIDPAGNYIFGSEFSPPFEQRATFIAVPEGALQNGIVLVNCWPGRNTLSTYCGAYPGMEMPVELYVAAAPMGGYQGIQTLVVWPEWLESTGVLPGGCADGEIHVSATNASMTCHQIAGDGSAFVGGLFGLTLMCNQPGDDAIVLDAETTFHGADPSLGPPTLIDARAECSRPAGLGGPPPRGDANCDFGVSSVDATIVLQYDAGLLDQLACASRADVNGDGVVNSLDASLILQHSAGLIDLSA
ncbi:MAG: dockerin type I repeat-containing protein [Dehalococcoidia bacterium]